MWKRAVEALKPEMVKSGETAVHRAYAAAEEARRIRREQLERERIKKLKPA